MSHDIWQQNASIIVFLLGRVQLTYILKRYSHKHWLVIEWGSDWGCEQTFIAAILKKTGNHTIHSISAQ